MTRTDALVVVFWLSIIAAGWAALAGWAAGVLIAAIVALVATYVGDLSSSPRDFPAPEGWKGGSFRGSFGRRRSGRGRGRSH